MEDMILTIGRIEDIVEEGKVVGKLVVAEGGDAVKVKNPRGCGLKARWGELQVGRAYSFAMESFIPEGKTETFTFVKDFTAVEKELATKIEKAEKPPVDNRTDDIHNQVAYKIAGQVFSAYVQTGAFAKLSSKEIGVNIGLMAAEIKAAMDARIEKE